MLLLHQAVAIVAAASQITITVTQWSQASSGVGQALTAVLAAGLTAIALGVTYWPEGYWRHRHWMMPAARILLYIVPTLRQTGVGAALMLERPGHHGWRGAAEDFLRLLAGTRLLGVAVGGATILMSPAATLATQTVLVLLTGNTEQYCATRLLRSPLTQRRTARLATALELGALPVLMMVPAAERASLGSTSAEDLLTDQAAPERVCHALLPFLSTALGIVLPTALAVYCWRGPAGDAELQSGSEANAGASDDASSSSSSSVAAALQPQGDAAGWACPGGTLLRGAAAAAAAGLNRALCFVFCSTPGVEMRALVFWWVLALAWWLCSRLAGGLA
ncbi:hypothetical protein ABPG75_012403 [Micractinium tetrahymenae]